MDPAELPKERILTVFQLAQSLKRTVEDITVGLWVEGEISAVKRPPSGHLYFCLKDEERDAVVDAVMYKREALRFGRHVQDGARLQLRGRASFYPPRGRLQWIAETARPGGRGALLEALERLKKKLADEGLMDIAKKRALPSDPRVVGVVTSRQGAAFFDICSVARRRGRVRIVLAATVVQGEAAPEGILRALDGIERLEDLDVLIVGRGGGSQEDLMAFNDERVVRRIAACRVPVVSAVGHETDICLADLVADARAATPSQAAEMIVPDGLERSASLRRARRHLARAMLSVLAERRSELDRARRLLGDPRFLLAEHQQPLDELRQRLEKSLASKVTSRRAQMERLHRRLVMQHPRSVVLRARARLTPLQDQLNASMRRRIDGNSRRLAESARALSALSPLAVLGRGYALAKSEDGVVVRDATRLSPGDDVTVVVRNGSFVANVKKVDAALEKGLHFDQESPAPAGEGDGSSE